MVVVGSRFDLVKADGLNVAALSLPSSSSSPPPPAAIELPLFFQLTKSNKREKGRSFTFKTFIPADTYSNRRIAPRRQGLLHDVKEGNFIDTTRRKQKSLRFVLCVRGVLYTAAPQYSIPARRGHNSRKDFPFTPALIYWKDTKRRRGGQASG